MNDASPSRQTTGGRSASLFRRAVAIIRDNKKAYLGLNLVYYGLVIGAMAFVASNPSVQHALTQGIIESFSQEPFASVASAYLSGNVGLAAILTFTFNFFAGSLLVLLVPSLLIPFSGVFAGLVRATLWGLLLAPTSQELQLTMIPHSLTLILEGQGYILAMLAAWVHGRCFIAPASAGATSHREGWIFGLRNALTLYILVAATLAIAALYEAVEVIYLVPRLLP